METADRSTRSSSAATKSAEDEPLQNVSIFDCGLNPSTAPLLQRSWVRLVASRDSADHGEQVRQFNEDVDDIIDRTDDIPQNLLEPCGTAEITNLAMEATALEAFVLTDASDARLYEDVAMAGNDWLDAIPVSGVEPFS